ncbi:MAG: hypothetical protein QOG67_1250 [Verrucomicrobiota bacterium]
MNSLHDFSLMLIGSDGQAKALTLLQISMRGFIIFATGLAMIRVGDRRSLAEKTAFDAMFIVLLGSMLSRAINGTAPFFTTIGAGVVLVLIHRAFAFVAFRSHAFGKLIKGEDIPLVHNGEIDWKAMKRCLVSKHDLEEDLRLDAKTEDLSKIRVARLERSGDISFIEKEQ